MKYRIESLSMKRGGNPVSFGQCESTTDLSEIIGIAEVYYAGDKSFLYTEAIKFKPIKDFDKTLSVLKVTEGRCKICVCCDKYYPYE